MKSPHIKKNDLTDLKHHQVIRVDALMTRLTVRLQGFRSLISPGSKDESIQRRPVRPLGYIEQYKWKHNGGSCHEHWTLQLYEINFGCPQDPLVILRWAIKPSEAYECHVAAHWLDSYWKMCRRRNTHYCTVTSVIYIYIYTKYIMFILILVIPLINTL